MAERFSIADLHLSHRGMVTFADREGNPVRPWGRVDPDMSESEKLWRTEQMDEAIIARWNSVVGPKDKVEVLGDVVINRSALRLLERLNGRKRLRSGNHDIFPVKDYLKHFEEVSAYKVLPDLIMSHIPIHEASLKERWKANVHGHLHTDRVMMQNPAWFKWAYGEDTGDEPAPPQQIINPRYLCVSVEHIDFTPIHMDEIYRRIREQQES